MASKIRDVMTPDPVTCDVEDTVIQAAKCMKDHAIGDVIVVDKGNLCGVVTDRDLVIRVLAGGKDPQFTSLRDVCSNDLVTLTPDDDIDRAVQVMKDKAIRRIPIIENGTVCGVVTMGDLAMERDEHSALAAVSAAPPDR